MSRRPGPPQIDGLYSLKIDNISYQTTPQDLRRLFEKYGEIGDIHIPRDRYTKQSKGFGFVRYYSRRDAEYAMDRMDGRWLDGREVRVAMARYERPIDERNSRGGDSRGGGYRGSRRSRSRSRSRSPRRRRSRSTPSRSQSRSASPRGKRESSSPRQSDPQRGSSHEKSASPAGSESPEAKNGVSSRSPSGSPR